MEPSKTIIGLDYPVEHGGSRIDKLCLRRPKVRDLKRAATDPDQAGSTFRMICDLAEVPPDLLEEIDAADFGKVTDWLESVLPKAKPSPSSTS